MVISKQALFWALGAAFALAYYTIKPGNLLNNFSNICVTGWGMLIGGVVFSFIKPIFDISGTFEPVSSAVLSIFLLNLSFGFMDFLGTAMIIAMVIILSIGKKQ